MLFRAGTAGRNAFPGSCPLPNVGGSFYSTWSDRYGQRRSARHALDGLVGLNTHGKVSATTV